MEEAARDPLLDLQPNGKEKAGLGPGRFVR